MRRRQGGQIDVAGPAEEFLVEGRAVGPAAGWRLEWVEQARGVAVLHRDTARHPVLVEGGPHEWVVTIRGRRIGVVSRTHRERLLAETRALGLRHHRPAEVRAALPGLVVRVVVSVGDVVGEGDPLVTVEAMKMQNEIRAPRAGRVTRVDVAAGQPIAAGALLVQLADPDP